MKPRKTPDQRQIDDELSYGLPLALRELEAQPAAENPGALAVVETAVRYAFDTGDRLVWALLLAHFQRSVAAGVLPAGPVVGALVEAFHAFGMGSSMDEAFGLRRPRPGRPDTLTARMWEYTNAWGMEALLLEAKERGQSLSLEEAAESLAEWRRDSARTILRHYRKHKKAK